MKISLNKISKLNRNMTLLTLVILFQFTALTKGYTQDSSIKNLVFEGAGIRGIAYAGVVQSLEQKNLISDIEKVGGTSAGAIIALLIALGHTSDELNTILSDTKFRKFNDGKLFFIGGMYRTMNKYGWYRGRKFEDWIGDLIEKKTGDSEMTFEQFYQKGYTDIYFTATCLNQQKLIVLSRKSYPHMKIKDAVRISMSIPLYYQAVFVDETGNTFSKNVKGKKLDIMVDGGIVGNFPIQIFDSVIIDSMNQEVRIPNYETLGIRIDSGMQIEENDDLNQLVPFPIDNFKEYISAFYVMVIESLNRQSLTKDDWNRTISVSSFDIGPKVRNLSAEQKERLVRSGRKSIEEYFEN
ncbi:MAG: patatin-like phospholipase family protein [Crocinitomicaceae bacterium]